MCNNNGCVATVGKRALVAERCGSGFFPSFARDYSLLGSMAVEMQAEEGSPLG